MTPEDVDLPPDQGAAGDRIPVSEIVAADASPAPDEVTAAALIEERYKTGTKGRRQDIDERKKYAALIFWLLCTWLVALFGLLVSCGLHRLDLSDKVLIAVITGTTADVFGIFYIVVAYLFPKEKKP
ncbi:MAG TPA: hypothetical protein VHG32_24555 [Thermoanaerobaculia bacterium]|nr:hypothetical protein [Thermoanaerobaculia bacterium]